MSDPIRAGLAHLTAFVMVASNGTVVTGLGTAIVVSVSKNGAAFVAGAGTKTEIGSGWYTYELTAAETDTVGPLAVKVTGAGAVQQNLLFQVDWAAYAAPAGTYILTATEASDVLRCAIDDPNMLMLLPQVDAYILNATGRDWAADTTINPVAKGAARMLLVKWHEDPGMNATQAASLAFGLTACLVQLEALALRYKQFQGRDGAGSCCLMGAHFGDTVSTLVGLVGETGDQSADFEEVITINNTIQQTSTDDLSENWYRAYLLPVSSL
jgi:hypothetical protein